MAIETYEAKAFIEEVHEMLVAASSAGNGGLSDAAEKRLLELEKKGEQILTKELTVLRIPTSMVRDDLKEGDPGFGDSKHPNFIVQRPVDHIEKKQSERILKLGTRLVELHFTTFIAHSAPYEAQTLEGGKPVVDGKGHPVMRMTKDFTQSGPEGFISISGEDVPFGAASALAARLLEAHAARLVV